MLCFNAYHWSDDFWFIDNFKKHPYWKASLDLYVGWDGRTISIPYHIRNQFLLVFTPELAIVISTAFFITSGIFVSKILIESKGDK